MLWIYAHSRSLWIALAGCLTIAPAARADLVLFSDISGLSAEAEFTLINPTTIEIRLKNTSTGVPEGFDSADQLLTGLSWDFGLPGESPGDLVILGGGAIIGPDSETVNFDSGFFGAGTDVGGEWGFGNGGGSGALVNFISSNTAGATPFGGPNLDGPAGLDGPQGGLLADPALVSVGGLGAIQNEIIATITLSESLDSLDFLKGQLRVEFGSDAAFITVPAPSALAVLGLAGLRIRRRSRQC